MIIGLCGLPGCGKDTAALDLRRSHGYVVMGFSDALKHMVAKMFDFDYYMLQARTLEERAIRSAIDPRYGKSPVRILEETGLALRKIYPGILMERSLRDAEQFGDAVFTDVRYPNEVQGIREAGGKVIMLRRGDEPEWVTRLRRAKVESTEDLSPDQMRDILGEDIHEAQWRLQCFDIGKGMDFIVDNEGSIGDLNAQITAIVEYYGT